VNSDFVNKLHPVDQAIALIKNTFFGNLIKKWSKHNHPKDKPKLNRLCNKTLTFDGNWKINRLKCAYHYVELPNIHFGALRTGCIQTPERKSFYCSNPLHNSRSMVFFNGYENGKAKYKSFLPKQIKRIRLGIQILSFYF